MYHKISQMCDKIDFIKSLSEKLRLIKYGEAKSSASSIDDLIQQIKYECLLISQDNGEYKKVKK